MKHAILGAGGVGGLLAASLAHVGEEVVLLVRPEKQHQHPETLPLERGPEQIEARVAIATSLADVEQITKTSRTKEFH